MMEKPINNKFQSLRWRLFLAYLGVMVIILGTSAVVVYKFFARSLYQQVERRLFNLAQAAAHSLKDVKQDKTAVNNPSYRKVDQDGDLDIPWKSLRLPTQSVEWFDVKKN